MNGDHIYWLYSAAAQSIAAFVALMLAGYALVQSLMETARAKDDTLDEIHAVLREKYHRRLSWLASITGIAIVLSLVTVFTNKWDFPYKVWLLGSSAAFDIAAIAGGLAFVVLIVDPRKYERAAIRELKERTQRTGRLGATQPASSFLEEFLRLETAVRRALRSRAVEALSGGQPHMALSFRQMIEVLHQDEVVDDELRMELDEIYKYRSLVVHGHAVSADVDMIHRTRAAIERLSTTD